MLSIKVLISFSLLYCHVYASTNSKKMFIFTLLSCYMNLFIWGKIFSSMGSFISENISSTCSTLEVNTVCYMAICS